MSTKSIQLSRPLPPSPAAIALPADPHRSLGGLNWGVKRAIDVLGSLGGLVVLSPVLLLVALAIKLDSPGPAIFRQRRMGLHGREFLMFKFRTMVADAEERREELKARNDIQDGPMFKLADDPRITRLGAFLRKTSLDEFPQLVNVLLGQMSLVGPRALPVDEVLFKFQEEHERLTAMPGITGLWQVSGRSKISSFWARMDLDLRYVREWSLWLDIKILFKTVGVVLKMEGSC